MTSCLAVGRQAQGITPATHEHIYRSDILRQPRPATVTHRNGRAEAEATCRIGVVLPLEADAEAGVVLCGAGPADASRIPAVGPVCVGAHEDNERVLLYGSGRTGRFGAADALGAAQAADPMAALRQVGVAAADGTVAVATGALCIDHAGHVMGDGFAVQANMMSSPDVWPAMASAFESSAGPLARRLLAALVAGEGAGGDARGMMSAALLVVEGRRQEQAGAGTVVDLRVDRSDDPLGELARLLDAADAFAGYNLAVEQLFGGDPSAALGTIDRALRDLPGEDNLRFVRAGALLASGATDAAVAELRSLIAGRPSWEVVVRSFATKGLIALPEGLSVDAVLR